MRALLWSLTALLPSLAQADILEFNFNGLLMTNGPPESIQATWFGNTLSGGTLNVDFFPSSPPSPFAGCFTNVSGTLPGYNANVIVNGASVAGGTVHFFFGAHTFTPKCNEFGVGFFGVSGSTFTVGGGVDISVFPIVTQSELQASNDPLGLVLNGSSFIARSTPGFQCVAPGLAPTRCIGNLTVVPEPDLWALFAVGGLGLLLFRRRHA